ncbi:hypothetical protein [Nitrospira sp. Nam74]
MEEAAHAKEPADSVTQARHLTVVARFMSIFQQGLQTLQKLRQGVQQQVPFSTSM